MDSKATIQHPNDLNKWSSFVETHSLQGKLHFWSTKQLALWIKSVDVEKAEAPRFVDRTSREVMLLVTSRWLCCIIHRQQLSVHENTIKYDKSVSQISSVQEH